VAPGDASEVSVPQAHELLARALLAGQRPAKGLGDVPRRAVRGLAARTRVIGSCWMRRGILARFLRARRSRLSRPGHARPVS
jgi:hypothetical protein